MDKADAQSPAPLELNPPDSAQVTAEAELARLRQVEAAAKEARAFLEGRRPGFAATYALDVLRAALDQKGESPSPFPVVRGGWNASGAHKRAQKRGGGKGKG